MAEQVDRVVHVFDEEHAAFAIERQKQYPGHRKCPPAIYDWAKGTVCGCGTPLLGPNPPIGGKGEQTEVINDLTEEFVHDLDAAGTCRVPWCTSSSDNEKDHVTYSEIMSQVTGRDDHLPKRGLAPIPQEAEPVKKYAYNGGPETDANHDFSEAMAAAFPLNPHNVHIGVNTGFLMLPETTAVRFLDQGNGLGEWVKHFLTKQQDYGDWAGELGAKGQFADMFRKWPKIRKAMWDGEPLVGEQLEEVLMDLIGHCFLSLMFLKKEKGEFK
jgi:hypothetical protein